MIMASRVGNLIRVWTDVGGRKPVPLLAKIVEENGVIFTIKYLSESKDKIWRYEEDTYEIDNDSVAEYLKTNDEQDLGFSPHEDGFIKVEADSDYVPSDEDEESDQDEESDEDEDSDEEDELSDSFEEDEEEDDDDEE
jgi:hypothetical protein